MKLKTKGIGYYLCLIASVLALVQGILLIITGENGLPTNATFFEILIALAVGIVVFVVTTIFPLSFTALLEVLVYSIAFGISIHKVAEVIAGYANGIMYAGGDFALTVAYISLSLTSIVLCIIACFFKQTKDEKYIF